MGQLVGGWGPFRPNFVHDRCAIILHGRMPDSVLVFLVCKRKTKNNNNDKAKNETLTRPQRAGVTGRSCQIRWRAVASLFSDVRARNGAAAETVARLKPSILSPLIQIGNDRSGRVEAEPAAALLLFSFRTGFVDCATCPLPPPMALFFSFLLFFLLLPPFSVLQASPQDRRVAMIIKGIKADNGDDDEDGDDDHPRWPNLIASTFYAYHGT